MKNEIGAGCFPKRRGFVIGDEAKRRRAAKKHVKRAWKLKWGTVRDRFRNDTLYRQQLTPKGWSDESIHMREDLGTSAGQDHAASYNPEAARMAFRRTARL